VILEPIKVEGLTQFNRALKKLDSELPKAVRLANNEAAAVVVKYTLRWSLRAQGKARRTVKAISTRTEGRARGGSKGAPYYPWLEFGGRVGRKHATARPYVKEGRYLYPSYLSHRAEVFQVLVKALTKVARESGLEVTG
jgi:hypothetical protein